MREEGMMNEDGWVQGLDRDSLNVILLEHKGQGSFWKAFGCKRGLWEGEGEGEEVAIGLPTPEEDVLTPEEHAATPEADVPTSDQHIPTPEEDVPKPDQNDADESVLAEGWVPMVE